MELQYLYSGKDFKRGEKSRILNEILMKKVSVDEKIQRYSNKSKANLYFKCNKITY